MYLWEHVLNKSKKVSLFLEVVNLDHRVGRYPLLHGS